MNPPSFIDVAPAAATLGQPTPSPTTGCGLPEAVLACCALAGWGNDLSGLDAQASYATTVIQRVKDTHTTSEILNWRARGTLSPNQWPLRWRWARITIRRHLPHLDGVDDLPESPDALDP